jgi:hypothetical protein
MADNFTNFSLVFNLPFDGAQEYALELHDQATQGNQGDELSKDFPKGLEAALEDWQFGTEVDAPPEPHGVRRASRQRVSKGPGP